MTAPRSSSSFALMRTASMSRHADGPTANSRADPSEGMPLHFAFAAPEGAEPGGAGRSPSQIGASTRNLVGAVGAIPSGVTDGEVAGPSSRRMRPRLRGSSADRTGLPSRASAAWMRPRPRSRAWWMSSRLEVRFWRTWRRAVAATRSSRTRSAPRPGRRAQGRAASERVAQPASRSIPRAARRSRGSNAGCPSARAR